MTIGTIRLNQQNAELFSELNKELTSIQGQIGSGKAELKLSENLYDVAKLSAAEERKSESDQFIKNSRRAKNDLEVVDVALDRLQNLTIRLQELAVESANGTMSAAERERYIIEASMIKDEFFEVANQSDSFGNALFSGISGIQKPFVKDLSGAVTYEGSAINRTVNVAPGLPVQQNYSGREVFSNIPGSQSNFSVFNLIDNFVESLKIDLTSNSSSNLFSEGNTTDVVFPSSGAKADISFSISSNGVEQKIAATIYGNDYSKLVSDINTLTGSTGVTAALVNGNRIRLTSSGESVTLSKVSFSNFNPDTSKISILKNSSSDVIDEQISDFRLESGNIRSKITEAFEHFSTKRAEVGAGARRADESELAQQDILMHLEEDINDIKEADLAILLTQLESLMTNKEAAQATFTRITSKSLFDFLG